MMRRPGLLFALLAVPSLATTRDFHESMQQVADYSQCVSERARAIEPKSVSVEDAINAGMTKCKRLQSRALSATRARMMALGLPADTAKHSAGTMFTSTETSMKESLRQELTKVRGARQSGALDNGS